MKGLYGEGLHRERSHRGEITLHKQGTILTGTIQRKNYTERNNMEKRLYRKEIIQKEDYTI